MDSRGSGLLTRQHPGARLTLEASCADDLHLQLVLPVTHGELDVTKSGGRQHLPPHQLALPQTLDELTQLPVGTQTNGGDAADRTGGRSEAEHTHRDSWLGGD